MPRRRKRPNWPLRFVCVAAFGAAASFWALQLWRTATTYGNRSFGIDWGLAILAATLDTVVAIWFFVVGATIGSFLNVVAYRLPLRRGIGGHSSCPYCTTPIDALDNIPILGWFYLRGRCRACRLPISPQYPLVEALTALAFLAVFVTELLPGGANLPDSSSGLGGGTLMQVRLSLPLVLRILTYLILLSGLIAAGLIALKKQRVVLELYAWAILPWVLACLAWPPTLILPWRDDAALQPDMEGRVDAAISLVAGAAAFLVIARLVAPLIYPGFDRRLIDMTPQTRGARQFLGGMAACGLVFGWQSAVGFGWCLFAVAMIAAVAMRRWRERFALHDLTVWLWLTFLVYRANWHWMASVTALPLSLPEVVRHVLGAIGLLPLAWSFTSLVEPRGDYTGHDPDDIANGCSSGELT